MFVLAFATSGLLIKRKRVDERQATRLLRGPDVLIGWGGYGVSRVLGPWFQTDTKQFHLDRDAAKSLIEMVVGEYERLHDAAPRELFIHAKSAFTDTEWAGFSAGCGEGTNSVGVQIAEARDDRSRSGPAITP